MQVDHWRIINIEWSGRAAYNGDNKWGFGVVVVLQDGLIDSFVGSDQGHYVCAHSVVIPAEAYVLNLGLGEQERVGLQ